MEERHYSQDDLHRLAEEVLRMILKDEALIASLGAGLSETCPPPGSHGCVDLFICHLPFSCPVYHNVCWDAKYHVKVEGPPS